MFKFAFIMNIPGENPKSYGMTYKTEKSVIKISGTDNLKATEDVMKSLVNEEFTLFNLCGDFTKEDSENLSKAASNVKTLNATYTKEGEEAMEKLNSLKEYGLIVSAPGIEETKKEYLESKECNTHIRLIKDMEGAKDAALDLIEEGVFFIELCSWFDKAKYEEMVQAIDNQVPVGTCGEI